MKKVISIRLYDNRQQETLDWDQANEETILAFMENAPEGTLFVFDSAQTGAGIIMCPGGGFRQVNVQKEGYDFVPWFTKRNITTAVLKYRIPNNGNSDWPQQDIQQAMAAMRRLFPKRIYKLGVMGASIGGYYAAVASTLLPEKEKCDFQILLYSVLSMDDELTSLSCRKSLFGNNYNPVSVAGKLPFDSVTTQTSPAFIVANSDDATVKPLNSILYAAGLLKKGVPVSLHVYPNGGHGFGFGDAYPYKSLWLSELEAWLGQYLIQKPRK